MKQIEMTLWIGRGPIFRLCMEFYAAYFGTDCVQFHTTFPATQTETPNAIYFEAKESVARLLTKKQYRTTRKIAVITQNEIEAVRMCRMYGITDFLCLSDPPEQLPVLLRGKPFPAHTVIDAPFLLHILNMAPHLKGYRYWHHVLTNRYTTLQQAYRDLAYQYGETTTEIRKAMDYALGRAYSLGNRTQWTALTGADSDIPPTAKTFLEQAVSFLQSDKFLPINS